MLVNCASNSNKEITASTTNQIRNGKVKRESKRIHTTNKYITPLPSMVLTDVAQIFIELTESLVSLNETNVFNRCKFEQQNKKSLSNGN